MSPQIVKQITVIILALIGIADGIWGTKLLGSLTTEVITVLVTLALAALGFVEMRAHHPPDANPSTRTPPLA